jgi:hypothetical protein
MFKVLKKKIARVWLVGLLIVVIAMGGFYFVAKSSNQKAVVDRIGVEKLGIEKVTEEVVEKMVVGKEAARKTLRVGYYATEQLYLKVTKQRCSRPIKYSLGTLDEEFNLSREEVLEAVKKAEAIWEKNDNRDFFEYDSEAKFKINLVYDERQELNQEKKLLDEYLDGSEKKNKEMEKAYEELEGEYNKLPDYLFDAAGKLNEDTYAYEMRVIDYNYGLDYDKGTEKKLNKERENLEARRAKLISQENYLNSLGTKMNKIAEEGKKLVDEHNGKIEEFNKKHKSKEGKVFEEGSYEKNIDMESISIYAFFDMDNLVMIIAHEFGHTLGIGHVSNAKSLMYFLNEKQEKGDNMELTNEDKNALNEVCD